MDSCKGQDTVRGLWLGTQQYGGHQPHAPGRTHHSAGPHWSQLSQQLSQGGWCLEEGAEGELCPRAGAACSLWLCPPLPLGALWERHTGANPNSRDPRSLQGSPLRSGGPWYWGHPRAKPARQIAQTQPCPALEMVHGLTPKPGGLQHRTPGPTATWGSSWGCAPSSDAHLARAAVLPMLFLTHFQHLKEAQESPELNCSRVVEPGQPAEFEGMPETTGRWREGRKRPRSPRYLLHGCGHS